MIREYLEKHEWAHETLITLYTIVLEFVYAIGMNMFIVPVGIYAGGLMGICQLIRTLLVEYLSIAVNFDIAGLLYYVFNIPIFLYAWKRMRRRTLVKTIIAVTFSTLFLAIVPVKPLLPDDMLGSVIVGSLITGSVLGLVLRCGSSSGGLDIIGLMMAMGKRETGVGQLYIVVNAVQFVAYAMLFDLRVVIYSMISTFLSSFALDHFHFQNINVEVKIITKRKDELADAILRGLHRGVTEWASVGAYTDEPSEVLYVIISKYEITRLRNIIAHCDPNAFVVIGDKVHVYGNFLKRL
ncbi:MAG: YitT family protein [Oscillospiraceae bacterium]|nr:YitT family protein [Oscillospiraceae bacterium]